MNIDTLRDFTVVAQEEGISAAADVLQLSQPTLSRRMTELESELGTTLFVRGKRGHSLTLTEEGRAFLKRAQQIVELSDRAVKEVRHCSRISGTVHIAAAQSEVMELIGRAACKTRELYPEVTFELHDGYGSDNEERLKDGLADFAVLMQPTDMSHYDFLQLPDGEPLGLLVRADDPLAQEKTISAAHLKEHPLIVPRGILARGNISGWLPKEEFAGLNIVATTNLSYNASRFVQAGFGAFLCLEGLVDVGPSSGLAFRPLSPPLNARLNLCWRKNVPLSLASRVFVDQVRTLIDG